MFACVCVCECACAVHSRHAAVKGQFVGLGFIRYVGPSGPQAWQQAFTHGDISLPPAFLFVLIARKNLQHEFTCPSNNCGRL